MTADVPDLAAALRESFEAARLRREQRRLDDLPCPECDGDRLRAGFTTPGRCHVPRADLTADWTTCLVVRDRDGDLWAWGAIRARWMRLELYAEVTADQLAAYAPLVPVLDADGMPVVTTVGDLTARHIGKTVRVEGYDVLLGSIGHSSTGTRYTGHVIRDGKRYGSIRAERQNSETPCEVLP